MKKSHKVAISILVVIGICLLTAVIALLGYRGMRRTALDHRPLVIIHSPLNREQGLLGEEMILHASTRAQDGVSRIELWVDGALVASRDAPGDEAVSPLVLTAGWTPETAGAHTLLVLATSAHRVEGQSTVVIEAVEEVAASEEPASVEEDTDEDTGTAPGAADDGSGGSGGAAPASDAPAPSPVDVPPGSSDDVLELTGFEIPTPGGPEDGLPTSLRVEVLTLETGGAYESLHCYIGFGDAGETVSQWYPDTDFDQATDESFAPLGDGGWDVATYMAGDAAPIIIWPDDVPLALDITCVGTSGGGTEAFDLGQIALVRRPETWDGITRHALSDASEGSFSIDYSISRTESSGRGHPIFLDPSMTPPTNLHMGFWTLLWDYEPREDEDPIDGFRIYLNDTLQWTEPADARYSTLPYEWLSPPCGETYEFTVTAFRIDYPDGPESAPSNTVSVSGDDEDDEESSCDHNVIVTFQTLSTQYLDGDRGSMYGVFYVNEQELDFDGRCHGSGVCGTVGMYDNFEYNINMLTTELGGGQQSRVVVDVPPGEQLVLGYDIHASGDGVVCGGERWFESDELDRVHTGTITSERPSGFSSRCVVAFTVEPVFGSPVVESGALPPLPMLTVEKLTVRESTGQLQIHVRNVGAATWPGKDLDVAVTWPDGSGIGGYTWPELILQPGDRAILEDPDLVPGPHPPLGACVLLDPGNEVPEEDDRTPAWSRGRYCQPLPDLTITNAVYESLEDRLLVTVENIGEGAVEHRNLGLQIDLADGAYFAAPAEWWSDVSLAPRGVIVMEWAGIGTSQRERMLDGYTAVIDPNNDIAEESGTNNEFTVRGSTQLQIMWRSGHMPYYYGGTNTGTMFFDAFIISGDRHARNVAMWTSPEIEISALDDSGRAGWTDRREFDYQAWYSDITISGDELLEIRMAADVDIGGRGYFHLGLPRATYGPEENWGARPFGYQDCNIEASPDDGGVHTFSVQPVDSGLPVSVRIIPWTSVFTICSLRD